MNKELASALANYVSQLNNVVEELSESHYWNGSGNKAVKALKSCGGTLIEQIHEAAKPVVAPTAPAATV